MATKKEVTGGYLKKPNIKTGEHIDAVIAGIHIESFDANKFGNARQAEVISFEGTATQWVPNNTSWNTLIDVLGEDESQWLGKTIRITRGCRWDDTMPDGLYCDNSLPEQKPTNIKREKPAANPGQTVGTHDPFA